VYAASTPSPCQGLTGAVPNPRVACTAVTGAVTDGPRILMLTTFDFDEYVYEAPPP